MMKPNPRKSYAIINPENGKIIKHIGVLQYARTATFAGIKKDKLERILKIKLEVKKL